MKEDFFYLAFSIETTEVLKTKVSFISGAEPGGAGWRPAHKHSV